MFEGAESAALIAMTSPAAGREKPRSVIRNEGSQKLKPMTAAKRTNCSQLQTHRIGKRAIPSISDIAGRLAFAGRDRSLASAPKTSAAARPSSAKAMNVGRHPWRATRYGPASASRTLPAAPPSRNRLMAVARR
ncbi:hypothetical protein D3C83_15280 [compost metagenome]